MRLGLLMRRMALDWTLSRRQRVDFGAPLQTWEQYSNEGRIWDLYIDRGRDDEKKPAGSGKKTELLRCFFSKGMGVSFPSEIR